MDASKPSPADQVYLDIVTAHIDMAYRSACDNFHKNPGGENWTRLETLMWALQGVSRGGLSTAEILNIIKRNPLPDVIEEIFRQHKDTVV